MRDNRTTEVALHHIAEIVEILHMQRTVQPELMPQRLIAFFGHAALAGHGLDRVAGDHVNQRKHQQGDAEKCRNDQRCPAQEKSKHCVYPVLWMHARQVRFVNDCRFDGARLYRAWMAGATE